MDRDEIIKDLDEHYNKKTICILLEYFGVNVKESTTKVEVLNLLVDQFNNKMNFNKLMNSISKEAKNVIYHLTWEGISTLNYIDSKYHSKISLEDFYCNTADPFVKIFKHFNSKELLFSTGLRELFKLNIEKPKDAVTKIECIIPENFKILVSDQIVINNLEAILDFIKLNNIKSRGLKNKNLVKTVNLFKQQFEYNDVYSDKKSDYILKFFMTSRLSINSLETLRKFLNSYKNGTLFPDENIDFYLFYSNIKGIKSNYNIDLFLKRGRYSFFNKLKCINPNGWINIETLCRELSVEEDTQIFDTTFFGNLLSVKIDPKLNNSMLSYIDLTLKENNEKYFVHPMCNGIVFLLYTLGGADIVTDNVDKDVIKYFRLTPLGRKLLGLSSTFKFEKKEIFTYKFHSTKRLITTTGNNSSILHFLKRVGDEIENGVFYITFKSFFSNCSIIEDVENNIKSLKNLLDDSSNNIWTDFISELYDRLNPLYNEQELIVVNFPRENKEFIDLILENDKIRTLFYMVEEFKGAFSKKNYLVFKKIMKDEGFFI